MSITFEVADIIVAVSKDPQKYKQMVASVGSQIFEKAIEKAVDSDKLEKFPFEKSQVEEIIKQAIDAYPTIIK